MLRNQFSVRVINERHETVRYSFKIKGDIPASLKLVGAEGPLEVQALEETDQIIILAMPNSEFKAPFRVVLDVSEDRPGGSHVERELEFLGPDNRLQNNDYLNPDQYLKK
jgi:hypothetical protein